MKFTSSICSVMGRTATLVLSAAALALMAGPSQAAVSINIDSSAVFGPFDPDGVVAETSQTVSYNSTSDFLVVMTGVAANNGDLNPDPPTPTVTYNGVTMNVAYASSADHGGAWVHWLASPASGSNDLVVDFGGLIDGDSPFTDQFQFAALSLANVDLTDPVAEALGPTVQNAGSHDTFTNAKVTEGDFLAWTSDMTNTRAAANYESGSTDASTDGDGNALDLLYQVTGDDGGNGESLAYTRTLTASDFTGGGDVNIDAFADRGASNDGGVVFNAIIPEPGSLALLAAGGAMLFSRRR